MKRNRSNREDNPSTECWDGEVCRQFVSATYEYVEWKYNYENNSGTHQKIAIKDSPSYQEQLQDPLPIEALEPSISEIDMLRQEHEARRKQWEKERDRLERTIFELQIEVNKRKGSRSSAVQERDKVRNDFENLRKDWQRLNQNKMLQAPSERGKELAEQNEETEKELAELKETEKELAELKEETRYWKRKAKQERQARLVLERKCNLLEAELRRMKKEKDRLRAQFAAERECLMKERQELEAEILRMKKEKDGLGSLFAAEREHLMKENQELEDEILELKKENDRLRAEVAAAESEFIREVLFGRVHQLQELLYEKIQAFINFYIRKFKI